MTVPSFATRATGDAAGRDEPAAAAFSPSAAAAGLESPATRETGRWLLALGAPFGIACGFVAAALGTSGGEGWTDWLFLPAILLVPVWLAALAYLAISSDTNATPAAASAELPSARDVATDLTDRRAA